MSEERVSVYEARIASGKTTYFIDARQAVNRRYYVSVTESRRTDTDTFQQRRVTVFEESIEEFRSHLEKAFSAIVDLVSSRSEGEVVEMRQLHPKAFSRWSPGEEEELEREFRANRDIPGIAARTGRTEKAVLARLEKMGLLAPST